jgi:hypothetical protein
VNQSFGSSAVLSSSISSSAVLPQQIMSSSTAGYNNSIFNTSLYGPFAPVSTVSFSDMSSASPLYSAPTLSSIINQPAAPPPMPIGIIDNGNGTITNIIINSDTGKLNFTPGVYNSCELSYREFDRDTGFSTRAGGAIGTTMAAGEFAFGAALTGFGGGSEVGLAGLSSPVSIPAMAFGTFLMGHSLDYGQASLCQLWNGQTTYTNFSNIVTQATGSRAFAESAESSISTFSNVAQAARLPTTALAPANARIHGNSLDYVGDTHVYSIRGPNGTYKIGQSMQGVRVSDGASIRAETQVRQLRKQTGDFYQSDIRRTFPDKSSARDYETKLIERFRRMYGDDSLPGNKTNR